MSKYKFHATDWFEIKNRGRCAVIEGFSFLREAPEDGYWYDHYPEIYDPTTQLQGKEVEIDGETYQVKGVETFAIMRSKEDPYCLDFSLLVNK